MKQKLAILGAGPIGLEAALVAHSAGYDVKIFERGEIADSVRQWGHVRMFSPFKMNASVEGIALLRARGVEVQVVQDSRCIRLMKQFITEHPELWNEDIGE